MVFASFDGFSLITFWQKCTEYNQNVYTFQISDGADIRILLQFDDVTRFEVEISDKE